MDSFCLFICENPPPPPPKKDLENNFSNARRLVLLALKPSTHPGNAVKHKKQTRTATVAPGQTDPRREHRPTWVNGDGPLSALHVHHPSRCSPAWSVLHVEGKHPTDLLDELLSFLREAGGGGVSHLPSPQGCDVEFKEVREDDRRVCFSGWTENTYISQ